SDGVCTASRILTLTVNNPTIAATGASACAGNTVALNATAFAPVNWYATPTATTPIATGNTYTTTAVSTSTVYAEAQSSATGTINSTMAAGNGSSGNMFDVVAIGNIEVNGVDVHISSTAVTTVEVWYRPGSFVGFESSNVGWTNVLTTTVTGMGTGNMTYIPTNFTVSVPAGQTYGFYVTANGGGSFAYTNGTAVGNVHVQNSDLQVLEGKGGSYFGVTISTRIWNGQIRYTKVGCTSPRIPVTVTVNPAPTLSVTTTNSILCAGSSATLIANGATTYSWSTGQTTQGIIVSPTVTTSYTLTGTAGGCSKDTTITQVVATCTGIDQLLADNSGVIVYPNPSTGVFNVILNQENTNTTLIILDALGRVVLTDKLNSLSNTVNAEKLANGVYMYRIVNGTETIKQGKLVKE
ncbi:MAG TPA: T9SS type A sorting domain-containing protein, partial [Bacteroidia bacterium]|nr:T9SS type A sorting domain-containing protein [Bacteroidia bacterium]